MSFHAWSLMDDLNLPPSALCDGPPRDVTSRAPSRRLLPLLSLSPSDSDSRDEEQSVKAAFVDRDRKREGIRRRGRVEEKGPVGVQIG